MRPADGATIALEPAPTRLAESLSLLCLALGLLLWWLSLPAIDPDELTDLGLVSVLPWTFYGCLGLLSAAFALVLTGRGRQGLLPLVHFLALATVLHGTPAIVYGTLRYSWAWKHLGIVDFIQRHGTVDPQVAVLPAYHNWPGLFLVTAWISDALGLNSVDLSYIVRFTPLVLNLGFVAALILLYRRLSDDRRVIMGGAWIFLLGNWVGQDYFSPQGLAFFLHLVLIALFLGPLRREAAAPFGLALPAWFPRRPPAEMPMRRYRPTERALLSMLALLVMLVIVATHQLTPLLVILTTAGLTVIGRLSPGYLVFALVSELLWLFYIAAPFVATQLLDQLAMLGDVSQAGGKLADPAIVSPERGWVVLVGRVFSGAIGMLTILGGLRRLRNGFLDVTAIVLTLAPLPLVAVAYGGESVFRTYLFSLPFLAFFAACAFFPRPATGEFPLTRILFAGLAFLGAVGFLFANNGKDREYRFAPDEVETAVWLYSTAPAGSLLIEGARSYPSQFLNYENFTYVPISEESSDTQARFLADPETVLARWMSDDRHTDAYFFLTRSQKAYLEAQGVLPPGAMERIEKALLASPRFVLAKASPNARVFKFLSIARLNSARSRLAPNT